MTTSIMHGRGHEVCHYQPALKAEACKKLLVQLVLDLALDLFVDELVKPQCIYRRGNRKNSGSTAPVINLSQLYATCNSSLQTEMLDTQEYDEIFGSLFKSIAC